MDKVPPKDLSASVATVMAALYTRKESSEIESLFRKVSSAEKSDDSAFKVLIGIVLSNLVELPSVVAAFEKMLPTEGEKKKILVQSYMKTNPSDADTISLMEIVKKSNQNLIGEIIFLKKDWQKPTIRKRILDYWMADDLWFFLEEHIEEIASRKDH